jgi:hypothetical protein
MELNDGYWTGKQNLDKKCFICGNCSAYVSSVLGYGHSISPLNIYLCPNCSYPTFFGIKGTQFPGPLLGKKIKNIDGDIEELYTEIRKDIAHECYTSAILLSRKFLMHIAVKEGAKPGLNFTEYVNYLTTEFLPPRSKNWVDRIRIMGNEANHEISLVTEKDVTEMLNYLELLLLNLYEYQIKNEKI